MNIVWSPTALDQLDEIYVYEIADDACNILAVMRTSQLIGLPGLGTT